MSQRLTPLPSLDPSIHPSTRHPSSVLRSFSAAYGDAVAVILEDKHGIMSPTLLSGNIKISNSAPRHRCRPGRTSFCLLATPVEMMINACITNKTHSRTPHSSFPIYPRSSHCPLVLRPLSHSNLTILYAQYSACFFRHFNSGFRVALSCRSFADRYRYLAFCFGAIVIAYLVISFRFTALCASHLLTTSSAAPPSLVHPLPQPL